ncbi:Bug family tripartite tricarboxylate transporter substrate binding protein [Roseomonas xinghualingensis]|uniref:Bug family tripartite tricarboxylate transporter substrate binding protein n=1 Tax=Roseomonas xinghualingensis TaxID=2986475 RepID=UPI0021F1C435|nr:tripartite tricarboxylate transporter substrate binding protein [Roseomonas sp. SXEYE001]MCV4209414.1 tripartite tricarboxylate transporter substrate binding protein [Roseomonas sp. SXEYE001]
MRLTRRALGLGIAAAAAGRAVPVAAQPPSSASSGDYPSRPVTLVVSWAPGGSTDFVGRLLAQGMSRTLGQQVVVENRAGASGTIGHASVARARPDGYTILLGVNSTYAMATHLFPQKGYDDVRSFAPIGRVAETPIFLCTTARTGAKTVAELIALAKRQPGKLSYASSGAGSSAHLATELFLKMADIDVLNVTYRGGAPAVQAMLADEVQMAFVDAVTALPLFEAKSVVPLGVSSLQRSPLAAEVPTIAESGLPGFECSSQFALLAPAGTPEPVIRKLSGAMLATLNDPDVLGRLRAAANTPTPGSPEEFPAYLQTESAKWGDVIRTRGITVN